MNFFYDKDGNFRGLMVKQGGDTSDNLRSLIAVVLLVAIIVGIAKVYEYFFVKPPLITVPSAEVVIH